MSTQGTSGLSDLGSSFASGTSGLGSNGYGFSLPADAGGADSSLAGLSGLQSGMSLPGVSAGTNSAGFTMPGSSMNLGSLGNSLGAASKTLSTPTGSTQQAAARGGGGVRLPAQNFSAPISDQISTGGTGAGNSLIELLQKYQAGLSK